MGCMTGGCKGSKKKSSAHKKSTSYTPAVSRGGASKAFGSSAVKIKYNRGR